MPNSDYESAIDSGLEDKFEGPIIVESFPKIYQVVSDPIPPPEAGLTKLALYIAKTCDETQTKIIIKATHILGRNTALKYLEFALRTQTANAGYLTKDGSRIRTLGGLFLRLIKDDPTIDPHIVKLIFKKASSVIVKQRSLITQRKESQNNTPLEKQLSFPINPFAAEPDHKKPLFLRQSSSHTRENK